jgi:hypothetical protein
VTIWRGFALCEACKVMAYEVPDRFTPEQMVGILMRAIEAFEDDETIDEIDAVHRVLDRIGLPG